jgi:hypothetical protein
VGVLADIGDIGEGFVSEFLAGALVAFLAYIVIERRLRLRRDRQRRTEVSRIALKTLRDELAHNRELAKTMRENLPAGALPYLGFELGGWALVAQAPVFTTLEPSTVESLLDAYRRLRAANEQHALLFDLTYGATSALSFLLAGASESPETRRTFERIGDRRADLQRRLLSRVEDLSPIVDWAISEVDAELAEVRAA